MERNNTIRDFDLDLVQPSDPYFLAGRRAVLSFIRKLKPDRVLAAFRRNAGLSDLGASPYPGWENDRIGGHAIGSYFSAAAMVVRALGDEELRARLAYIVLELRKCQLYSRSGFLSAASPAMPDHREIQFDIEEGREEGRTWVPWYALHKVLRGLTDIYVYADNREALAAAESLADWVADRCSRWDRETRQRILGTEYGGMNDALYLLYELTGRGHYRRAAEAFDDPALYAYLTQDENALSGVHANATIPKLIGAARRAEILAARRGCESVPWAGHDDLHDSAMEAGVCVDSHVSGTDDGQAYFAYADAFFRRVVETQMYATGGIGDMEHFRPDRRQDANRTQCNAESCCVYNMRKLAKMLFQMTGDPYYADYSERTLFNARLGSVHPNGGTTYFNPMGTGFFKVFGKSDPAENVFWCCTGTGMEDFMLLTDSLYFRQGETLIVNQYVSSRLSWPEMGLEAVMAADIAEGGPFRMTFTADADRCLRIRFRVPKWTDAGRFCVHGAGVSTAGVSAAGMQPAGAGAGISAVGIQAAGVNTAALEEAANRGDEPCTDETLMQGSGKSYVEVVLTLEAGKPAVIEIDCPAHLAAEGLPDAEDVLSFRYGPYVLAAVLPTFDSKELAEAGIEVVAPAWKMVRGGAVRLDIEYGRTIRGLLKEECLPLPEGCSFAMLKAHPEKWMKRDESAPGLRFELCGLTFRPYHEIVEERYGIYWYFRPAEECKEG